MTIAHSMGMRQPTPEIDLYVASKVAVPANGGDVDIIIDCTPEGPTHQWAAKVRHVAPQGDNGHQWTRDDLDRIVGLAMNALGQGQSVLIHCNRGVSRSTCAAAAVLLAMGVTRSVNEAVTLCRHHERAPVKTAQASLCRWWDAHRQLQLI